MTHRKILVVGGAGLIGGHTAIHLASLDHEVTIAGRHAPTAPSLKRLAFARCDYLANDFGKAELSRFDTLVFAAGNDIRQFPPGEDESAYFERANTIGVPAFFERARKAGIARGVYIGSYYSALVPAERIQASGYMRSRLAADLGVRALASPGFATCTLDSPYTIGHIPQGPGGSLKVDIQYLITDPNPFAPTGGANYMSAHSFAQGVAGAIERAESGANYLMGDESLSHQTYFNRLLELLGREPDISVRTDPHPTMPDQILYAGKGATLAYEPDPRTLELLGYHRGDLGRTLAEAVAYYKTHKD